MISQQERKEFKEFVFGKWEAALNSFKDNLALFCRDFLGYKDLNAQHQQLCDFLLKGRKFKLILMPRYTFKSCICTGRYSLRKLIFNPNLRILIYSDATTKAEGFLTSFKNHIEGKVIGSDFRKVFGAWETDPNRKCKWSNREVIISKRTSGYAEATIETAGIGTSLTGKHYDIIIFDDIVSDLNVTTKEQMDKVAECYQKALSLLVPGGEVLIIGTRWHFGDLYGRIIAENDEKDTFDIFIKSAEENGELLFEDIGEHSLTREFLNFQKKQQGSYIYSCLYMNSPTDPETAIFKPTDFSFYNEIDPVDLYITGTCDPAGVGKDFTAITVVGTDNEMNIYILDIVNKHLQPTDIVNEIMRLHYKWKFRIFGLETNFYRGTLKYELDRSIQLEYQDNPKNFPNFGLHEFKPSRGENKENRIRALQPFHERGVLKFPGKRLELLKGDYSELSYQMIQFPYSTHDDIIDSLAYHIPLMRKGGTVKESGPPRHSPAWIERRLRDRDVAYQRELPKYLRKRVRSLVLS